VTNRKAAKKHASAAPRYLEIARDIEQAILSGRWSPGHRVPTETELTKRYSCARMTVSKALSSLAHAGLIERRRRLGTFVAVPRRQAAVLEVRDLKDEIVARGSTYRYQLLSRTLGRALAPEAAKLGLTKGAPILRVKALHIASDAPFSLEERLINVGEVPRAAEEPFTKVSAGAWLIAHIPWTEAEHRISATSAGAFESDKLQIAPQSACLVVERQTWRLDRAITYVRLVFPEKTMHYLMARFTPRQN
jgi:GntR family histidine utilization transcriptional repressor